ncbi:hypothetical protein NQ318_021397 [Aromia moschata]|uniref:Uncharacterized protein n=1 Tax=Aromia moschata TaxID=1265417 RepID=A0AAV8ZBX2_9CUCU|nr:hypothetical protein NQ318_021397 [Aromia moschata]
MHPDLPPLNQGTISKIEAQYREMGHVRNVPSKRQAVVDDDTKLNLLLALEENPITPARQLTRDNANLIGETRVEKSIVVLCFVENVQFFVSTPKVPVPTPGEKQLTKHMNDLFDDAASTNSSTSEASSEEFLIFSDDEEFLLEIRAKPKNENYFEVTIPQMNNKEFIEHFRISRALAQMLSDKFEQSEYYHYQSGGNGKLGPF